MAVLGCFNALSYRAEWLASHLVALASAQRAGDRQAEAWVLNNLGMVCIQQRMDDAIGYFDQALAIGRDIGDRRTEAQAANNLADAYIELGRPEDALELLKRTLALQIEVGHRYGQGVTLNNLGEAYLDLGRPEAARSSGRPCSRTPTRPCSRTPTRPCSRTPTRPCSRTPTRPCTPTGQAGHRPGHAAGHRPGHAAGRSAGIIARSNGWPAVPGTRSRHRRLHCGGAALTASAASLRWCGFFGPRAISWCGPAPGVGMTVAPSQPGGAAGEKYPPHEE